MGQWLSGRPTIPPLVDDAARSVAIEAENTDPIGDIAHLEHLLQTCSVAEGAMLFQTLHRLWEALSMQVTKSSLFCDHASDEHDENGGEKDSRNRYKHCREPGSGVFAGHKFSVVTPTIGEESQTHRTNDRPRSIRVAVIRRSPLQLNLRLRWV